MASPRNLTADELSEFAESERGLRLARTKTGLALGTLLMPGGAALDWFEYPGDLGALGLIRTITTLALAAALLVVLRFDLGRRVYGMSLLMLALPVAGISAMIAWTDGGQSSYFIGLLLLLMVGQLVGLDAREAAFFCTFTIATYVIAVIAPGGPFSLANSLFPQGLFFLLSTSAVCVLTCYITWKNRLDDFRLRKELDDKNRQLQELDRMRAGFLAAVTHELATPLSLILGPLDQLLADTGLPGNLRQSLTLLRRNAVRLRTLVDDLLDAVRMDNRVFHLKREAIDSRDLIASVLSAMRPHAESRGIAIQADLSPGRARLSIDAGRMERVLFNLLGNAIKFSPPGSAVELIERRDGGRLHITVRDRGPGIPREEQPRIFERFYQAANNPLRRSQGLGLGLALAKEIVEWHGGQISVDSVMGQGTSLTVSLPIEQDVSQEPVDRSDSETRLPASHPELPGSTEDQQPEKALTPANAVSSDGALPTVLIVDDEHDLQSFLADCLGSQFRTVCASTAAEGAELAVIHSPSVVLLDYMLPDENGLAVARRIRAEPALVDTKIIMLTAVLDENVKIEALRCGVDDFLSKPFSVTEIRARVDGLLRSSQLQSELRNEREQLRRSLTQLRKTEKQLFQSEKLRAIGNLAAGLLHEINNPVNIAQMAVEVLPRRIEQGKDVSMILADVRENLQRVSDIVGDLRAFAYPQQDHVQSPFLLLDAVTSALRFTSRDREGIATRAEISEDSLVDGSKTQITQLLINLIVNAAAAVRKSANSSPAINIHSTLRGERIYVTVSDTGVGIPAEEISRVCDPFYTTAEVGKGMGLGLSICDTIARNHGGELTIHSQVNVGTDVTFDLPLVLQESSHGYATRSSASPVR